MKILAPVNKPKEVEKIIWEGASEIYCGVLPNDWKEKYTNIFSPNRREWTSANLSDFDELKEVVNIAHAYNIPAYLTVNTFYTEIQYPLVLRQIEEAKRIGVDAFIIADVGLLLALREKKIDITIHISNTGTAFNSETVRFYKDLGASRVILPRQLMMDEISELVKQENEIEFEVFIMNSGCKNIDGFCTFHHGVSEVFHPFFWNFFKNLNLDRYLLEQIKRLPCNISARTRCNIAGIDSACLLNYKVIPVSDKLPKKDTSSICKTVSESFSLLSGADPCGACDLYKLSKIGIHSVKIVGRNYQSSKKINDVKFLKNSLFYLEQNPQITEREFKAMVKAEYKNIYKMNCNNLCYRCN